MIAGHYFMKGWKSDYEGILGSHGKFQTLQKELSDFAVLEEHAHTHILTW